MNDSDLEKYCVRGIESGATNAKQIDPASVVTAAWVRLKCQFGCPGHGTCYSCPPLSPTPEQTRAVLDCYNRAILFHLEAPPPGRVQRYREYYDRLTDLEGELFKDGYYKVFLFVAGRCHICKECAKPKGDLCNFGLRARPSMEGCGIDVYQTARNNGFFLETLRERTETQNIYCLMVVD